MSGLLYRLVWAAIAGSLLIAAAGCSTSHSTGREEHNVRVTVRDFRISAPKRIPSGELNFSVRNKGPDHHEIVLVRGRSATLPLRGDDLTVDEDGLGSAVIATLEPVSPGVHEFKARLRRGHYWLFCNMAGHYMGGMRTEMVAG